MSSFTYHTTGEEVVDVFPAQAKDKTIFITGASTGSLGAAVAVALATGAPRQILLAGRTEAKLSPVIDEIRKVDPSIKTTFVKAELGDLSDIRNAAATVNSSIKRIDILINSAGVMATKDFEVTVGGVERQFGISHIGHFLLTNLLIGKIVAAGEGARIVNLTSTGYEFSSIRFDDYNFEYGKAYNPWLAYGQAKTANILFALSLADKLKKHGIQAYSAHPGFVPESSLQSNSGVNQETFMQAAKLVDEMFPGQQMKMEEPKTLMEGSSTPLVAALDPSIIRISLSHLASQSVFRADEKTEQSGGFLQDCKITTTRDFASSLENAEKLWKLSEELVGEEFSIE